MQGRIEQRERLRENLPPGMLSSSCAAGRTQSTSCAAIRSVRRGRGSGRRPAARDLGFAVIDRPLDVLLRDRFATFRKVHLTTVGSLRTTELDVLPTGHAPHFTMQLHGLDDDELHRLVAVLGPPRDNQQYGK